MARKKVVETVNLGQLQANLEASTERFRLARDAKFAADQEFDAAEEERDLNLAHLNQGIAALKSTCGVAE
jgi:hypothetical protein